MRFQVGRIDHDRLVFSTFGCQAHHDPDEDAIVAPALPTVIQRLRQTICNRPVATACLSVG